MTATKNNDDLTGLSSAYVRGLEWIDELIRMHECAVQMLKTRRSDYLELVDADGFCKSVDQLGFAINDVNNVQRNLRLDLAPRIAAEIAAEETQLRDALKNAKKKK